MGLHSTDGPWAGLLCALPRSAWVPVQGLHRENKTHLEERGCGPEPLAA